MQPEQVGLADVACVSKSRGLPYPVQSLDIPLPAVGGRTVYMGRYWTGVCDGCACLGTLRAMNLEKQEPVTSAVSERGSLLPADLPEVY